MLATATANGLGRCTGPAVCLALCFACVRSGYESWEPDARDVLDGSSADQQTAPDSQADGPFVDAAPLRDAGPLNVEPSALALNVNSVAQLTATGGVPPYSWSIASGPQHSGRGSIDDTGRYVSPPNPGTVELRVLDSADNWRPVTVRIGGERLWLIGGGDMVVSSDQVSSTADGETWALISARFPHVIEDAAAVVFRDQLYVLGGWIRGAASVDSVWRSGDGVTWTEAGHLPSARGDGASFVFRDRIWFAGGLTDDNDDTTSRAEVWSSSDGLAWESEAPLPTPIAYAPILVFDDSIWLLGGLTGSPAGPTNAIWSSSDGVSWLPTPAGLPQATASALALVANDKMWLIGGNAYGNSYDDVWTSSSGSTWNTGTPLPAVRSGGQGAAVGNRIIFVGGLDGSTVFDDVWRFDAYQSAWRNFGPFAYAAAWATCAAFTPH